MEVYRTHEILMDSKLDSKGIPNTFKYHVSCTDGNISLIINLFYLYFPPSSHPTFGPSQEEEVTSTPTRPL